MEEKKVKITAFYISSLATQQTREWTFETIQQAKEFIEGNMDEISKEEKDYANYKIPKFYDFKSRDAKERKLYELFCQVNLDIKNMVDEINKFKIK
jgi:uncharacterized UBP type Zn finger protein